MVGALRAVDLSIRIIIISGSLKAFRCSFRIHHLIRVMSPVLYNQNKSSFQDLGESWELKQGHGIFWNYFLWFLPESTLQCSSSTLNPVLPLSANKIRTWWWPFIRTSVFYSSPTWPRNLINFVCLFFSRCRRVVFFWGCVRRRTWRNSATNKYKYL